MKIPISYKESDLYEYPRIAYKAKPNDVIVFDKPFSMSGFEYNAIAQREDGALMIFDYKSYKVIPREEEDETTK